MKSLIRKILREARWRPHFQEDIQNIAGQILQDIMNNSFQFTHEVDDEIDDEDYDEDDYYVDDSCENPYVTFAISVDGSSCKKYDDLCLSVKVCVVEIDEEFPFDVEAGNEDTDIDISIKLSPHFSEKDYHKLYASIRENLRHEVEHAMQNLNPNKEQFQDFETKYEEFNARHEVPAYVRGFWDKAKILGEPLGDVMWDFLNDMIDDGMITKDEADDTYVNWLGYARRNIGSLNESYETFSPKHNICDELTANTPEEVINLLNRMQSDEPHKSEIEDLLFNMKSDIQRLDSKKDVVNQYLRKIQNILCK